MVLTIHPPLSATAERGHLFTFMHFLFLSTDHLLIRPLLEKDLDDIWKASQIPGLPDLMYWIPPASRKELDVLPRNEMVRMALGYGYNGVICDHAGRFLGRIFLNEKGNIWELGYWLLPEARGKGYVTEAGTAVLKFAFDQLNLEKIVAHSVVHNEKSTKVLERLGFTLIQTIPGGFNKAGQSYDLHEFAVSREDFLYGSKAA